MTKAEAFAYNPGIHAVLDMARQTAAAMDAAPGPHHVRNRAAIEALCALADNAEALLIEARPESAASLNSGCGSSELDDGI